MSCCVANLSGILRSFRSSWLVWQQTGPSKVISSPASCRDYWGALAWLPPGRVILLPLHVRALAAGHAWSTAVREAISRIEQKEVEAPEAVGLPSNLDLRYKEGFLEKQRHLIPPVFSDPLFIPKMAKAVFRVAKPLVVSKTLPSARSREVSSAPPQPGGSGPKQQVLKSEEPVPSTSQSTPQVQEQISEASDTDSDGADEPPPEREPPDRTLKVRLPLKPLKRVHQTTASSSKGGVTPSKVRKETEAYEAEVGTLTGPSEAALQKARFELYQKDLPAVQEVRAQILELKEGEVVTQWVLD